MSELFFFFSVDDPSIPAESFRLGHSLIVNRHYGRNEDLILISKSSSGFARSFQRFYVLPEERYVSDISMSAEVGDDDVDFCYILDRIGAASIDLVEYKKPAKGEVCVGSLRFHSQTHPSIEEPLEPRPQDFFNAYKNLRSYIKRSAQPVRNKLFPKTVYVFPQAMMLISQDFSRSPWPSLELGN